MKFKSLFLLFVFSIFSFASFDIQAKPTNTAKAFSANRAKEAERLCSQKRQDACLLLQVFYVVREDTKKLTSIYNKACKSGLGNKDECTSTNISKTVNNAVAEIRKIKNLCDSGNRDACGSLVTSAAQIADLEMKDIYAKKACRAGLTEACAYDVNAELSAATGGAARPQQSNNAAKNSALNDCRKGNAQVCNSLIGVAVDTNDENLMQEILQAMCKSGKHPDACKVNAKASLQNAKQQYNFGMQQAKQMTKECDSKNTLETCAMAFEANLIIGNEAGIKKYAGKLCKLGGEGKNFCKANANKNCKAGDKFACELQKHL